MNLTNHWDFDNNVLDLKSSAPLLIKKTQFGEDRFGKKTSSIQFSFGQMKIPGFSFRGSFSVLAWIMIINPDATQQSLLYCEDKKKQNNFTLTLQTGSGKYSFFSFNNKNILTANKGLPTKKWTHVGVTLASDGYTAIWYDGKPVGEGNQFQDFSKVLSWKDCYIGYTSNNAPNLNLYLDDLMFFAASLTESDVNLIKDNKIELPLGPFANWQFDGDLINGVTSLSLSASLTGVSFVTDRRNQSSLAILFKNGTMPIPNVSFKNDNFTLMFWIKPTSNSYTVIINGFNQSGTENFRFGMQNLRVFSTYVTNDLWTNSYTQLNKWTHLAISQSSNKISLYYDGQVESSNSSVIKNLRSVQFGSSQFPCLSNLDDVMFFDRALSDADVQLYMGS